MLRKSKKSPAPASRVSVLKRVTPSRKVAAAAVSRLEKTISATIESELAAVAETAKHLDNLSAPIRKLIETDRRALASVKALHRIAEKDHKLRRNQGVGASVVAGMQFRIRLGLGRRAWGSELQSSPECNSVPLKLRPQSLGSYSHSF